MNTKLLRITLYTNCEGWRRMDNIFNLIPILWRLKHMCMCTCTLYYLYSEPVPVKGTCNTVPAQCNCNCTV